jgi:hypothetical protein
MMNVMLVGFMSGRLHGRFPVAEDDGCGKRGWLTFPAINDLIFDWGPAGAIMSSI